ncbi:carboxypeptidase-like regulatory domain-containing protein [Flavobacterium sp. 20NA77.7]|uniref:Carboxypeptidase-like regulatory domain-containing protein n=1 Tax=Flavobacterium nakdongensis TaxID=3073563 RepID=A0ABY9RAM7_9FLAO|nr:carboxypeptidase-like regulatory domain-containing protein [Flavobacterium sp. 20NA77.7]WMW77839.1 carboxypeptidase-like regulatory domain-containing protein [Flavobacterium sp. 20NA77.7]
MNKYILHIYKQPFRLNIFIVFFLIIPFFSIGQSFFGTVKDALGNPLQNANVLAKPIEGIYEIKFAIADHLGRFKLDLQKNTSYEIQVSYIGFVEKTIEIKTGASNEEYHFNLIKKDTEIKEIVIKYDYNPVLIKKDTSIYDVKAFTNGTERKLKDQLEKIPGIEVDKNGGVFVQGKKVTKFYVENQSFFGGGTKLGIENIPADAVDKIEVLDNFNETGFLKNVSNNDDLAMNVKLKSDKKNFIFGDLETGIGGEKKNLYYKNHAGLFYFSPKTNISYIGDVNNIGKSTFTFEDVIRFQGGTSSFLNNKKQLSDLFLFTNDNTYVVQAKSVFNALNFRRSINSKIDVEGFGIVSKNYTSNQSVSNISYLQNNTYVLENKNNQNDATSWLSMGNVKLNYLPNSKSKWLYNGHFQVITNDYFDQINSLQNNQLFSFESSNTNITSQIKQFIEWHKQHSEKHTTTFVLNQTFEEASPKNTWITDRPFLAGLIPLQNDTFYTIQQLKKIRNHTVEGIFKHYWALNNHNHLYSNVGVNYTRSQIIISEKQTLTNGEINDFSSQGFGNNLNYRFSDLYVGAEYKFKIGKWINRPGIYYHLYQLKTAQQNNFLSNQQLLFEPRWKSELKFNNAEALVFDYKLANTFSDASKMIENYTLQSYNSVFKGNALLTNERYHAASLYYTKTSTFRGLFFNAKSSFYKKTRTIRNEILLDGVNQFTFPLLTNNPETNWQASCNLDKKINKFRVGLQSNFNWFTYIQTVNNQRTKNERTSKNYGVSIRTTPKKWPLVQVNYSKTFNRFFGLTNSKLISDNISLSIDVTFFKNFTFKSNYEVTYTINNLNQKSTYKIANALLCYQKKESPFRWELSAQNFLNNGKIIDNSFSDFMVSTTTTFVMPRIILVSVNYKI